MSTPLISLCIPTHDGRRAVLEELLGDIAEQTAATRGRVEVCISDNASQDGTDVLIEAVRARLGCPLTYRRHEHDRGMSANMRGVVELATGRYCWLLGSDDRLAVGAVARVCAGIDGLSGACGYTTGGVYVDADDARLRSRQLPAAFHPPGDEPRMIEGLEQIVAECSNAWIAMSFNLVEREAWLAALRGRDEEVARHPTWPQVLALGWMVKANPRWGWLPEPLVRMRNAPPYLFERGDAPLSERWIELIGGNSAAWATVLGRGSRLWRVRQRALRRVWGGAADVRATKLYAAPTIATQLRLAWRLARDLWPAKGLWTATLPAALEPRALVRLRRAPEPGRLRRGRELRADSAKLTLSTSLPGRMTAGSVAHVQVAVRNRGLRQLVADGPNALLFGVRWWAADGTPVPRETMGVNDLATLPVSLPRDVRGRGAVQAEVALLAPLAPGRYRVEILPQQAAAGWLDAAAVTADVDVV